MIKSHLNQDTNSKKGDLNLRNFSLIGATLGACSQCHFRFIPPRRVLWLEFFNVKLRDSTAREADRNATRAAK
jgi:hypothetical protein